MTLRRIEGFDFMPTGQTSARNAELWAAKRYYGYFDGPVVAGSEQIPGVQTGRFNFGKAMTFNINQGDSGAYRVHTQVIPNDVSVSEGYAGSAIYRYSDSSTGDGGPLMGFFDLVTGLPQFTVMFAQFGIVKVYRGTPHSGTLLIVSSPGTFQEDEWFYAEVHGIIDGTAGEIQVRINTKVVVDLVSANTQNTPLNEFTGTMVGCYAISSTLGFRTHCSLDDVYFCDTAGAVNNGYLGNVRVKSQFTSANSAPLDFSIGGTSPAATNWQSVLNTLLDDSKYVFASTIGDQDTYELQAIINSPLVCGIQIAGAYRQDDATQKIVHNVINSGGVEVEGQDHYLNQTYTFYQDIWELNPYTGVQFTGTELNALLIGPKIEQ